MVGRRQHIWPTSGSLSGNLRPFLCNYQRGGFAVLSGTAAELQGCKPGIETVALREVRMQTCSTMRPFFHDNNTFRLLHGGEPMSNHNGGALVRRAIACRPSRSLSASSAEIALSSSSTGAFFTIARAIARRWR